MPNIESLRRNLTTALSDRRISVQEAEGLVREAQAEGLQPEEAAFLRDTLSQHQDSFETGAADVLRRATVDGNRRDLADPAVLNKHTSTVAHTWVDGQLFVDGAKASDVVQGSIADCYMVAGFASVAATNPDVIENAIKDNGDGTFTVKFFQTSYYGAPTPVEITVDGQLPTENGSLRYAKGADRSELWVGLLEKAYAQWKGGYESVGNGGSPGAVMGALLGRSEQYTNMYEGMDTSRVFTQLQEAFASGKAVVAATHGKDRSDLYNGSGMYAWHAYSVLGVSEEGGQQYVELRNPWGRSEPSGNGADDGVFRLTVEDFAKYYAGMWVN